jgi:antibiotic biosynthesis monooxygenase (ABM) superfamily enzyme
MNGVTLVSAVRLCAGTEATHRSLHDAAVACARRIGGLVSDELVPAIPDVQPETVALLRFQDRASLDRWLSAPERHAALDEMAVLAAGQRTITVLGGFGGWFSTVPSAPRRWKQATAVLGALIPVSLVVTVVRQAALPGLPLALAVAATSAVNVVVLTWMVMPTLTSRLEGWLTR